jgi:hypothetical protein
MYSPWGEFKGERDENLKIKIFEEKILHEKNRLIFQMKILATTSSKLEDF